MDEMDTAVQSKRAAQAEPAKVAIDLGLKPGSLEKVGAGLSRVLADSYLLYLKTQNFHWNVTGPTFGELHAMFEQQYQDLAAAVDELAERIRAIGQLAPGSFKQFSDIAEVEEEASVPPAKRMIEMLAADHELVVRRMREVYEITNEVDDVETGDMMIRRMQVHAKHAWMLRSYLQ
jgi:starvation-inducible DNA-binding protein